jgi:hypothetical protein
MHDIIGDADSNGDGLMGLAPPWKLACLLRESQGADVLRLLLHSFYYATSCLCNTVTLLLLTPQR